jgi:hypothetical protein
MLEKLLVIVGLSGFLWAIIWGFVWIDRMVLAGSVEPPEAGETWYALHADGRPATNGPALQIRRPPPPQKDIPGAMHQRCSSCHARPIDL